MDNSLCLARAYGGEPLRRYVVGRNKRVVYIINPSVVDSSGIQGKAGVGFPPDCIFRFEKSLYDSLLEAYESGDSARLGTLWGQAQVLDVLK